MPTVTTLKKVNIRPEVSVLSIFPHLNYKAWYALAEFVDNSLQSFLSHRSALESIEGKKLQLLVDIDLSTLDGGRITIRDNAAGIREDDYERAFKTAAVPPDRSGLSEFGVGMKSAACWFARHWTVRTSALGENVERLIAFDVEKIVRNSVEDLLPNETPALPNAHFTEVILQDLHSLPQGRTITKIKEHIASIYRIFLREGVMRIRFNGEHLSYDPPSILNASYYKDDTSAPQVWKKNIDLDFGEGMRVYGFAALRETASTSSAGFALFRRGRLIQGSGDEGYRPEYIFKKSNSFIYQRLFGELHIEGFQVSHTKDGIQWADYEDIFLEYLKDELNKDPLPLLNQAAGYRVRPKPADLKKGAQTALESTAQAIERDVPPILEQQLNTPADDTPPPEMLADVVVVTERVIDIKLDDRHWKIVVELSTDPAVSEWLSIADQPFTQEIADGEKVRRLEVRLSLAHPFMDRFAGSDSDQIEPLLRVAAALALAETTAREGGAKKVGTVRRYLNEYLRNALSKA